MTHPTGTVAAPVPHWQKPQLPTPWPRLPIHPARAQTYSGNNSAGGALAVANLGGTLVAPVMVGGVR